IVDSRKNTDYPIKSLLDDDEKLEIPADEISMDSDAAEEKSPLLAHQTAARETVEVTPDMTYKITDFPDKVASMNAPKPGQEPAAKAPTVGENEDMTYRITDKLPTVEKQAPTATIELEPDPIEDVYGKGVRKLPAIPIGKSVNGRFTNLNISGNITYICGNRGDDRKTISDRIITQITACTHPDDVELWLFDCGDGEFMRYADDPAAHIKYLVFDTGADSSTDFAEVVAAELDRRVEAFAENGWSDASDIPADVLMPRILVAVNAFPRFAENIVGTTKYFGRNHNNKLSKLFKGCGGYGIHFLLIGDEFSDGGERPSCLDGVTINCAIAVSGRDRGISSLFSDIKLYDNEVESLRKIPSGCAFVAEADSSNGLTLVRLGGENAKNEHSYTEAAEYSDNLEEFVGKSPFIGDRKAASRFDDRRDYRAEQIKNRDDGECLLFLGEPCRFMGEYPVRLFDDFGENLLTIAPAREKGSAALMVKAALRSLQEQGIVVEILACRSNPVYSELHRSGELDGLEVFEGGKAEARIKELADMLDSGKRPNVFEIVLGGDLLMASMSASDQLSVLKRALVKGPRDGAHFMFISGSVAATEADFLLLFRHKLVFACPYNEAEKLLRDPNCDLPENAFRLSNDYDELTILPYSM
ncbi:MAG: hypothetical protein K2J77_13265, partial [Oscillospiraceae bacterium]|nr:hypothetical protein [Oscillospiraceae bacterium]